VSSGGAGGPTTPPPHPPPRGAGPPGGGGCGGGAPPWGPPGIGCGVLMAPVIPFLSDHPDHLRTTVRAIAAAGATSVTPLVLHLRPGAREWFMAWLSREHPYLVRRYERLYAEGAYAPTWYQRRITRHVHELATEFGIGPAQRGTARRIPARDEAALAAGAPAEPGGTQLSLL
ncbi:hypothetical protein ACFWI9_06715, partial [Streptomyces sp. NPDC127084]